MVKLYRRWNLPSVCARRHPFGRQGRGWPVSGVLDYTVSVLGYAGEGQRAVERLEEQFASHIQGTVNERLLSDVNEDDNGPLVLSSIFRVISSMWIQISLLFRARSNPFLSWRSSQLPKVSFIPALAIALVTKSLTRP